MTFKNRIGGFKRQKQDNKKAPSNIKGTFLVCCLNWYNNESCISLPILSSLLLYTEDSSGYSLECLKDLQRWINHLYKGLVCLLTSYPLKCINWSTHLTWSPWLMREDSSYICLLTSHIHLAGWVRTASKKSRSQNLFLSSQPSQDVRVTKLVCCDL